MGLCEFHVIQGMRPHLKLRYVPYYFTQYILPKDQAQKMVESQKHDKDVKLHENPNKCLNILDEQMDSLVTVYNYANPRQRKEKSAGHEAGVGGKLDKLDDGHSNTCFHRQHPSSVVITVIIGL